MGARASACSQGRAKVRSLFRTTSLCRTAYVASACGRAPLAHQAFSAKQKRCFECVLLREDHAAPLGVMP